ncbi:MAG: hypothetical protein HOB92_06630 [Candidatus Cloacimonetes bacterium]|jgi:hypothetical protein|nr:hypothetical protein [Candidatus Cloacimonadota bacterium]
MKTNFLRKIIAVALCGFGMWVVAGLWHNLILPSLYKDTHATHDGLGFMLAAYFVLAGFMVYLYPLVFIRNKPIINGMKLGMFVGVLWIFPYTLVMAGAHETSAVYVFKNTLWHIVEQGIGGIIVASILRKGEI